MQPVTGRLGRGRGGRARARPRLPGRLTPSTHPPILSAGGLSFASVAAGAGTPASALAAARRCVRFAYAARVGPAAARLQAAVRAWGGRSRWARARAGRALPRDGVLRLRFVALAVPLPETLDDQ
jgi:hypothetical protein